MYIFIIYILDFILYIYLSLQHAVVFKLEQYGSWPLSTTEAQRSEQEICGLILNSSHSPFPQISQTYLPMPFSG